MVAHAGATGLLGSWLTEALVSAGASVTALVRDQLFGRFQPPTLSSVAWLELRFYDANGNEVDKHQRVPIRIPDPIPHYRHGRVEPRLT